MAPDAEGEPTQSAADAERDARTLSGLARLYAKLVELNDSASAKGKPDQDKSATKPERPKMRTDSAAILRSAFSDPIRLGTLEAFLSGLVADELQRVHYDFELWARDDQLPPAFAAGGGPWTTWLMLGGRGKPQKQSHG